MSRADDSNLTPSQLAIVRRYADRLLRDADAYGRFPTPIDDLMAAAKLTVVDDELLDERLLRRFLEKAKAGLATIKSALSKVLGLFDSHDRLVLIDRALPKPKKPFVKLHEAGHGTLPHQSRVYRLIHDCDQTLDPDITDLFEREANVFASETLFQGDRFAQEAHDLPFGAKVPIMLASKFGGSNYAAFRRYVTTNPHACCVVVLEPLTFDDHGRFVGEVRRIVASASFHRIYDAQALFPVITPQHPLARAVPVGRRMSSPREVILVDRNADPRNCVAEAFDTRHQILVLVRDVGLRTRRTIIMPGPGEFGPVPTAG